MIQIQEKHNCSGCFACYSICPKHCIEMVEDGEGFLYPRVDVTKCIRCNLCVKTCPIITPASVQDKKSKAYAIINKDERIRESSSSGGIFTAIAEYVIEQGGVVFGATFSSGFEVVHIGVEKKEQLEKLRGSKYVQSIVGTTYTQAQKALEEGKKVLFSGTPCQIAGLKAFLGKEYKNLYTQDLICHGVPSSRLWKLYLKCLQEKYNSKIEDVCFRNKKNGWHNFEMLIKFENGEEIMEPYINNLYMQAFLRNLCLRASCYNCSFKGVERVSDVTLADFWGIERVLPEMDDDKGTSLVIVQSAKGEELLDIVKSKLILRETNINESIENNPCATYSVKLPRQRKLLFRNIQNEMNIEHSLKKSLRPTFLGRVRRKIKSIFNKFIKLHK